MRSRAPASNRAMFWTMVRGAMLRRRGRALAAVCSSAVGAAALFCLAAVCLTVPAQMTAEMRHFGANLVVVPVAAQDGQHEAPTRLSTQQLDAASVAVATATGGAPKAGGAAEGVRSAAYRYENVRVNKVPFLLAGIDVADVKDLNGHWQVQGSWPSTGQVLIGLDVAQTTGLSVGATVTVEYLSSDNLDPATPVPSSGESADHAGQAQWRVAGIVDTGGREDDIIYAVTADVETLTGSAGQGYDVVEYSVDTSGASMDAVVDAVDASGQGALQAEPVAKITSGDSRIITMLDTLFWMVSLVVLALTTVGVSTTMTIIVTERLREIGLRKALGASASEIAREFHAEALLLGLVGGTVGIGVGHLLATGIGVGVFDRPVAFSWWLAAVALLVTALVAVLASYLPVRRASRIDPAVVLREE